MAYSEELRSRIDENAKKAHEQLVQRAKKLEEKAFNKFAELFDDESERRLKEMFGAPVGSARVHMDVLLQFGFRHYYSLGISVHD